MLRFFLPLGCSLVLHMVLGWWLRDAWPEAAAPVAGQADEVFEISLVPLPAPSQAVAPVPVPKPAAKPDFKPPVTVQQAPARVRPRARPTEAREMPASAAPVTAGAAAAPAVTRREPVAPVVDRVLPEVLVQRPSFRQAPTAPRYPALARQRRLQGVVWVEVRLGVRGEQRERRLLRSSGVPMLDRAALEAVQTWHFNPERVGGQAVPSRVQIPIEFNLLTAR